MVKNSVRIQCGIFLRRFPRWFLLLVVSWMLAGCATTGRGKFPEFQVEKSTTKTLAILPPAGIGSENLRVSMLSHLRKQSLRKKFRKIGMLSNESVTRTLSKTLRGNGLSSEDADRIRRRTNVDLVLGLHVHEFAIKEFSTTETKTLFRTSSDRENTNISTTTGSGDSSQSRHTTVTSSDFESTLREIPITKGNIRVVMSLSALVYDVEKGEIIWRGRRIERAEDEMEDLSTIELKDIVIERIMFRIVSRLAA